MGEQDWLRKIKRTHVVTFTPMGILSPERSASLVDRIAEGLSALGYEVPGEHPIDIGRFAPKGNFEISYGDVDRIDLASWESAVVYALAHADAFGQVEAHTRTTVLPAVLTPS